MIVLLTGDNIFAIDQALKQRRVSFSGEAEVLDGADLTRGQLVDITTGQTLFSTQRLIVIKQPSECKELWSDMAKWLAKLGSNTTIVLVESGIDKRTAAYKWLQKNAEVKDYPAWTDRDQHQAVQWVSEEAKRRGMALSRQQAVQIVMRAGYDQWALYHALEKLSLAPAIDDETIEAVVDTSPTENVFTLLETAISGRRDELTRILKVLRQTEEPYRVFGLLISQVQQLALLKYANRPAAQVAKDTGARSPYMLQKLETHARGLTQSEVKITLQAFATADIRLKSTDNDPWLVVESLLHSLAKK